MMNSELPRFSGYLVIFALITWGLHYGLQTLVTRLAPFDLALWEVYLFLALVTLIGYLCLLFVHSRDATKTGFGYVAIGFFKMLASVVFLYPVIVSKSEGIMADILSFFLPYFLFLAFELSFVVRLLAKK